VGLCPVFADPVTYINYCEVIPKVVKATAAKALGRTIHTPEATDNTILCHLTHMWDRGGSLSIS